MTFKEFLTAEELRTFINENREYLNEYHPFTAMVLGIDSTTDREYSDDIISKIWSGACRINVYFSNIEMLNIPMCSYLTIFETIRKTIALSDGSEYFKYADYADISEDYIDCLREEYPYFDAIYQITTGLPMRNNIIQYAIHRDTINDAKANPFRHFILEIVNGGVHETTSCYQEQIYSDMIKQMNQINDYFRLGVYNDKSVKLLKEMLDTLKELTLNVIDMSDKKSEEGMEAKIKDTIANLLAAEYFNGDVEFMKLLRGYLMID